MRRKFNRVFLLVVAMLLSLTVTAQAEYPVVEWTRQLGTSSNDEGCGVSVDSRGNAYVTGYTEGSLDGNTHVGNRDLFLTKYNTAGDKQWTRQLGTASLDSGQGESVDGNGNIYVTGFTYGGLDGNTNTYSSDMFLTKYNTNGVKLWTQQLGTTTYECGRGVSVDNSGNAYVTGDTYGELTGNTSAGLEDIFLTKYDTEGAKLWTRQLGTTDDDFCFGVSVDSSGNAYVTGYTYGGLDGNINAGEIDIFLVKYDTYGAKLWTRQLGTTYGDSGKGVSVDSSGNVYVTGFTDGGLDGNTKAGSDDIFLTKYNTDGVKLWTRQLGTTSWDVGFGVSVDDSGNAYVTGYTYGNLDGNTSAGNADMFLTKYDTDGVKLWTCQLGTDSYDYGCSVSVDGSGNAYVSGWTKGDLDGNNTGGADIFLVKISSVPEPNNLAMLAGIAFAMLLYRKCKPG